MKRLITIALPLILFCACASNPLMTGKPQHWKGRSAEELRAGLGEPTRVMPQPNGAEIWEYVKSGEFHSPEQETFRFGGGRVPFGGIQGGATTVKEKEGIKGYEDLLRFEIRGGKVRSWYAQRTEGGRVVWSDH